VRIEPALTKGPIELDDYWRAVDELLPVVGNAVAAQRNLVEPMFLATRAASAYTVAVRGESGKRGSRPGGVISLGETLHCSGAGRGGDDDYDICARRPRDVHGRMG
jgi:hypothetical protein